MDELDNFNTNVEMVDAFLSTESEIRMEKYKSITGREYILLPKPALVKYKKAGKEYFSPSLCNNCQRYLFLFCNRPCVVPCGHTFCEMCIVSEKVECRPCKKTYKPEKQTPYIINTSLIEMFKSHTNIFGKEATIDSLFRSIRSEVSERTMAIHAYLPIWAKQFDKGRRLQMTLNFLLEEQNIIQNKQKFFDRPWIAIDECAKLAKLKADLEKVVMNQDVEWSKVIKQHQEGLKNIPKTLCTKGLNLKPVLEEFKNVYFAKNFHGERFYLKISKGYDIIHLHSGFWSSSVPDDFVKNNKIWESILSLNKATKVFLDVCFYVQVTEPETETATTVEENRRVYISLLPDKENYTERMLSLFIGQWKTLKGTSIFPKINVISIPEPKGIPYIFRVPSTDLKVSKKKAMAKKLERSLVIGHSDGNSIKLEIILATRDTSSYMSPFYFGKIHSGIQFLETEGRRAKKGIIKDCGLVVISNLI